MIIVVRADAPRQEMERIVERVRELGFRPHVSGGHFRIVIGVIGGEIRLQGEPFSALPGVEHVVPILKPFKLASREFSPRDTIVAVGPICIGGGSLAMIAGPCAVESYERLDAIAAEVKKAGANLLRGGAFKPRTSPYSFQGLGEKGLNILREVGAKHGLPVVTEVMDPRQVALVDRYADMLQVGARSMQNFAFCPNPCALPGFRRWRGRNAASGRRHPPNQAQPPPPCLPMTGWSRTWPPRTRPPGRASPASSRNRALLIRQLRGLKAARAAWLAGDRDRARQLLTAAFNAGGEETGAAEAIPPAPPSLNDQAGERNAPALGRSTAP
jgi:hypothetical protein